MGPISTQVISMLILSLKVGLSDVSIMPILLSWLYQIFHKVQGAILLGTSDQIFLMNGDNEDILNVRL